MLYVPDFPTLGWSSDALTWDLNLEWGSAGEEGGSIQGTHIAGVFLTSRERFAPNFSGGSFMIPSWSPRGVRAWRQMGYSGFLTHQFSDHGTSSSSFHQSYSKTHSWRPSLESASLTLPKIWKHLISYVKCFSIYVQWNPDSYYCFPIWPIILATLSSAWH